MERGNWDEDTERGGDISTGARSLRVSIRTEVKAGAAVPHTHTERQAWFLLEDVARCRIAPRASAVRTGAGRRQTSGGIWMFLTALKATSSRLRANS